MKTRFIQLTSALLLGTVLTASGAVRYVNLNNPAPASPFTEWSTAATNIQDAIDVAAAGEEIVVTNGVYETGGRVVYGTLTNRVAVTKPVTVRSVNGPAMTIIKGYQVPGTTKGAAAIRCVYLAEGAVLAGFTLTNGATQTFYDSYDDRTSSGGGVWCESAGAVVTNCALAGNSADWGGGAYSGTINNCTLTGNSAHYGGGAYYGTLNTCTLTGNSAGGEGGGAGYGTLNNCALTGNSARYGGGAAGGWMDACTLNNCTLTGNSAARYGGGAFSGTLNNCTLTFNSANWRGGGTDLGTLNNCIVYYNTAPQDGNSYESTLNYSCTTPLPAGGVGNLSAEPELASAWRLSAGSPCRGAGNSVYASGQDIDGEPWDNPPSIGCDEYWSGALTGAVTADIICSYTNVAAGFVVDLRAVIDGRVSASQWNFGDGVVVSNRLCLSHTWGTAGDYVVELRVFNDSHPAGVAATVTMHVLAAPVHYVALGSLSPVAPYSSWETAATNIQDAVDLAVVPGAVVLVSNGVYQTGGRVVNGALTNRVVVTNANPITVRSVNGPEVTMIAGCQVPVTTNGDGAVRCAYLGSGAVLVGFTLTNGATRTTGETNSQQAGGGVWCASPSSVLSNCVLAGNSAYWGGGASHGTLNNCTLIGNSANSGGGTYYSTLNNCVLTRNSATSGGGAYDGALGDCTVSSNTAWFGGGAYRSDLFNCALIGNSAIHFGGGTDGGVWEGPAPFRSDSTLINCTVVGNSAGVGGGIRHGLVTNSIVYHNTAGNYTDNYYNSTLSFCCTYPLPADGGANFTNLPLVMDLGAANLRLQSNSPCINAGKNAYAPSGTDLDGNPRNVGGTVDVGAYEFQSPASAVSYAWLYAYGLTPDNATDASDPDQDLMNTWQEWIAGTDPTNAASALRMLSLSNAVSGISASWSSVTNRKYSLERATYLGTAPAFGLVRSNLAGVNGSTTFTDTNATGPGPFFYRVRVEQ